MNVSIKRIRRFLLKDEINPAAVMRHVASDEKVAIEINSADLGWGDEPCLKKFVNIHHQQNEL